MAQIETKANIFYSAAISNGCIIIDTKVKNNHTLDGLAAKVNETLIRWINENPEGNIIITAGIGPDGHISGMKPLPKEDFVRIFESGNQDNLVVGYNASTVDKDNPQRVTTTMNFFRRVKNRAKVIVYAINKSDALHKVMSKSGEINETPARILNEMSDVTIFSN